VKKIIFTLLIVFASDLLVANSLNVYGATVTRVQVYETSDDSVSVWIFLNGLGRVGPNPVNQSFTCELYSAALAASMSGKKVDVTYVDNGSGTYWCDVRNFSITNN